MARINIDDPIQVVIPQSTSGGDSEPGATQVGMLAEWRFGLTVNDYITMAPAFPILPTCVHSTKGYVYTTLGIEFTSHRRGSFVCTPQHYQLFFVDPTTSLLFIFAIYLILPEATVTGPAMLTRPSLM